MPLTPAISIVIPTYNRPRLLYRSLRSIFNQTYDDFEVIVVDDHSDKPIYHVVTQFDKSKLTYIRQSKRLGGAFARNTGLKFARGRFIAFLDDDDEWLPTKLEKQVEKLSKSPINVAVVYCGYKAVYRGESVYEVYPKWKGDIFDILLEKCCIGSPTPLIRRKCLEDVHCFDVNLPSCQDWDLWIRLSRQYFFDFVPEILAVYHIHGEQISVDIKRKIIGRENILRKYYNVLRQHRKILSWHYRRLGSLSCVAGDSLAGLKYFINSLLSNPLNGGSYIHLLLFFLSRSLHRRVIFGYGTNKVGDVTIIS